MRVDERFLRARRAVVAVCRRMYERGYIVGGDGNVSVRLEDPNGQSLLLTTPSGARKGRLRPSELVLCDGAGEPLPGESGRPSSELAMHRAVYDARPDVRAVVHAHPPCAVAHSIAECSLASPLVPEVFCQLGEIVTIPYTTPTTQAVADAIMEPIRRHDVLILSRHGSVTAGRTLTQAFDRLEVLEHAARISLFARVLARGTVIGLSAEQLQDLARTMAPSDARET